MGKWMHWLSICAWDQCCNLDRFLVFPYLSLCFMFLSGLPFLWKALSVFIVSLKFSVPLKQRKKYSFREDGRDFVFF